MQLRIGENILTLRKDRKVRQEELADFLGVTKASVSKWETKQSYPDILLLPQIAAFFNISIDELLGYEPQLSKEQIVKIYTDLSNAFSKQPFEEVMERSKELVKEYYSCYPFLLNIAILWLNHYSMSQDQVRQTEIQNDIIALCEHIIKESPDVALIQNATVMKSMIQVIQGKVNEVIEVLQPLVDARHNQLSPDGILLQAFQIGGKAEKANHYNQIMLYTSVMNCIENGIIFISLHMQETKLCLEMMERTKRLIELFNVEYLNPNATIQFYYQCAIYYCVHEQKEEAVEELSKFVQDTIRFLQEGIKFRSDEFFDFLEEWFEESPLGGHAPRNEKNVFDSISVALMNPVFAILEGNKEFQYLKKRVSKKGEF